MMMLVGVLIERGCEVFFLCYGVRWVLNVLVSFFIRFCCVKFVWVCVKVWVVLCQCGLVSRCCSSVGQLSGWCIFVVLMLVLVWLMWCDIRNCLVCIGSSSIGMLVSSVCVSVVLFLWQMQSVQLLVKVLLSEIGLLVQWISGCCMGVGLLVVILGRQQSVWQFCVVSVFSSVVWLG